MKIAGMEVVESTKIPEGEIHVYSFPRIVGFRTIDEKIQYMVEHDLLGKIVGLEIEEGDTLNIEVHDGEEETQED